MKLLFDFFPIVLFFITFKAYDDPHEGVLAATAVIIAATAVQVAVTWMRNRRVEKMHLITLALVVVFGGLTLIFKNELFIKWKPSIVNWLFAAALALSHFFGEHNLIRRMMGHAVELPQIIWTRLNTAWALFFVAMGLLNLYVVYNFDTDTWVDFKLFGLMGWTLIFVIAQTIYLMRHVREPDTNQAAKQPQAAKHPTTGDDPPGPGSA
ncbi:MAG: septation protein A [Gammaproteobacteria bacterium]